MMGKSFKILLAIVAIAAVTGVVLVMGGFIQTGRIGPTKLEVAREALEVSRVVEVERRVVPVLDYAVGTLRPRTEAIVSAQTNGRVLEVLVRAGDRVRVGEVLVRLDARELQSRVDQARRQTESASAAVKGAEEGKTAAEAALTEAESNFTRVKGLFDKEAATKAQLEAAESAFRQNQAGAQQAVQSISAARAELARAQEAVREARVGLGYTTVTASEDGEVSRRACEPGDLAWPGKALITLQSEGSLRLEAGVREGLIGRVPLGADVKVRVAALDHDISGKVDEIVPSADPVSRTFLVKVGIPATEGLYPGMFGRLLVPLGERQAIVLPDEAIARVGQLETVLVDVEGRWTRRYVRTGGTVDGRIEILSGLFEGERVGIPGGISSREAAS